MWPDAEKVDVRLLPVAMFATKDILEKSHIHEGEPVFFSGFFTQFPGTKRTEPIVRQGIIAMIPMKKSPLLGWHVISIWPTCMYSEATAALPPLSISQECTKENPRQGQDYRLLGVVNGEVFEDEDFNLTLTATS